MNPNNIQPVPPVAPEPTVQAVTPPTNPGATAKKSVLMSVLTCVLVAIVFAAGGSYGGYAYGKKQAPVKTITAAETTLTVPKDATIISQCAKGRGTQYVLPKDIPQGPVYNVYQNKVIGVEFMIGKDDLLTANKNFLNLPLSNVKYDHINVGLLSTGHAGFPEPHYHVDVYTVPASVSDAITCQ